MSVEYFDIYVRTNNGFVAVKNEFICICTGENRFDDRFDVLFYRNRQASKRCIAFRGGGNMRWCREQAESMMKKVIEKEASGEQQ